MRYIGSICRVVAVPFLYSCLIVAPPSYAEERLTKIEPDVISVLAQSGRVEVLVRLRLRELISLALSESDALQEDKALTQDERRRREAQIMDNLRLELGRRKSIAIPSNSIPGLQVVGSIALGAELVGVITKDTAIGALEDNPQVERVFLNRQASVK